MTTKMRNKILGVALCTAGLLAMSSCSDYLETDSPSTITAKVATSSLDGCQSIMEGAYTSFHVVLRDQVFANGLFYTLDAAGSDIERHGGEQNTGRLKAETFYNGGDNAVISTFTVKTDLSTADEKTAFYLLNAIIITMNQLTDGITEEKMNDAKDGNAYKEIYGQAVCMKATCYREIIKYYGDVFSVFSLNDNPTSLSSRLDIYDKVIAELQKAKDLLPDLKDAKSKYHFSKQYAYALLGRIAMEAAGYQTYRLDITDASRLERHPEYTDAHGAAYARPTNYKSYYDIAYDAFKWVAENPAGATFDANDYTTFFTQLHNNVNGGEADPADESIFEDDCVQGSTTSGNSERPYAIGRPSTGSNGTGVCKSYGQCRINPAFYYGVFDPKDKRRDVSCTVTGSYLNAKNVRKDLASYGGKDCTYETILSFQMKTSGDGGGIACGKFDENRQVAPYYTKQRNSGINHPYMRISEVYLGLAEAALMKTSPDQSTASAYYNKTHQRAGLGTKNGVTLEDVVDERGFEFAGEGDRRWTLIRTGLIGKKVQKIKDLTKKMIDGLKTNGYYTFDNGNTIGNYIYYKGVDPTTMGMSSRMTPATPDNMLVAGFEPANDTEATQFPGWRGQHDWDKDADYPKKHYGNNGFPNSNVAIKGLFTNITTTPDGYYQMDWGKGITDQEDKNGFYYNDLFKGWNFTSAPIYLVPLSENALIGGYKNGYDFTSTF